MKQILALLLFVGTSYAAFEWQQLPAYPRGMSGAFTAISYGADALFWNPAGLKMDDNTTDLLISYEKPFGGMDAKIRDGLVGFARKIGDVGVGIAFNDYGASLYGDYNGDYGEQILALGAAIPMNEKVTFGMKFNYYRLSMPRFNPASALGMDIGIVAHFYSKWSVGLFGQNISGATLRTADGKGYRLPSSLSFGVALRPTRNTLTSVDIRKEYDRPVTVAIGQSVEIGKFVLRGGVQSQGDYLSFSAGFTSKFRGLRFDYSATVVPSFPVTHTFTIGFRR